MRRHTRFGGFTITLLVCSFSSWVGVFPVASEPSYTDTSNDPVSVLSKMSSYLGGLEEYGFKAETMVEHSNNSGRTESDTEKIDVWIKRPDMLHSKVMGTERHRDLIYDATLVTLVDWNHNTISRLLVPNSIDAMLDTLTKQYGLVWPLADFLYHDPADILLEQVNNSVYLGVEKVSSFDCHRLEFTQENVDWQVWIESGDRPVPRKLVIHHKNLPKSTRFVGLITEWSIEVPMKESGAVVEGLDTLIPVDFIRIGG